MGALKILAAILGLVALAVPAGLHEWPISSAIVVERTSASLAHSLGLALRRPARVRLSLLPRPTLHLDDVEIRGQNNETILTAPEASVRLALGPLLVGDFAVAGASLRQPTILVDLDSRPFASGSAIAAAIGSKTSDPHAAPVGALEIQSGLIRIVSAKAGLDTLIEDVAGALNWPNLDSALVVDGHAMWRDQAIDFAASLSGPVDLLKGGRSDGRLSIVSRNASLKLDGEMRGAPARFDGAVSAEIRSAAALQRLLGAPDGTRLSEGPITVAGQLTANTRTATLAGMRLDMLGARFEGALAFAAPARRPAVSGTLATDQLDIGPLVALVAAAIGPNGRWSAAPLDFAALDALDVDLRISAAQVKGLGRPLADAAIELVSKDGRASATLAEATAYGGLLKADIAVAPAGSGYQTHVSASLANADLGLLCGDFGWSAYSGLGAIELAFDSVGDSPAAFAEALQGKATLQLGPGVIDGVSFEEALRRSARRPIDVFNDMRMGRTVFGEASAALAVAGGGRGVVGAAMTGAGVDVALSGSLDLLARSISARATATQTDESGVPVRQGPGLEFDIAGPWSAPSIRPLPLVGGG